MANAVRRLLWARCGGKMQLGSGFVETFSSGGASFLSSKSTSTSTSNVAVVEDEGKKVRGTAAKLTIAIKTAIKEFKLGDVPNAKVCGLPTERSLITVIRGPHIDKKSREQFDIQTRKWRVTIDTETSKLRDKLEFLKQHRIPGVEIKAKFQYKTRLDWPLKPTSLSDADKWRMYMLRSQEPSLYTASKLSQEFGVGEQQVYEILRSMEERKKHIDMFGDVSSSTTEDQ